jgi:DNA-binding HxlR family transcriptional regulator
MYDFGFKRCPLEVSADIIGGKWTLQIMRDLFMEKKRFSDFLDRNPGLSSKVLSTRLKGLQERGLIEKCVVSVTPLRIEYHLTEKGIALGDVLFHVALFSIHHDRKEVYGGKYDPSEDIEGLREVFRAD